MEDILYFQQTVYCVQFASMPDFLIKMQASKFIPHTDMNLYPTVAEKLEQQLAKSKSINPKTEKAK